MRVLLAGFAWRTYGSERAGETLVEALSGDDEQNRMLAGMSLVKAGARTVKLIEQRAESRRVTADLVRLLPDLDTPESRALLDRLARAPSAEVADAARHCLQQLGRIDAHRDLDPKGS